MEITVTGDVTLHTARKYCEEDILVRVPTGDGNIDYVTLFDGTINAEKVSDSDSDDYGTFFSVVDFVFVNGHTYRITLNEHEYICKSFDGSFVMEGASCVGNKFYFTDNVDDDTKEPFAIYSMIGNSSVGIGCVVKPNGSYHMTIREIVESIEGGEHTVNLQDKSVTPTEQTQIISADNNYDGLSSVTVKQIPTEYKNTTDTTAIASDILKGKTAYTKGQKITGTLEPASAPALQIQIVDPTESKQTIQADDGYDGLLYVQVNEIPSDYVGSAVDKMNGQTVVPGKVDMSFGSGKYWTNPLIVKGDANLLPENIVNGKSIFGVVGAASTGGGDSSMNVQAYHDMNYVKATAYSITGTRLTCNKTGTYKISWMGFRNTNSGTSGSQLYIDGKAYGFAYTSFTSTYGQSVVITNVSLTEGQDVTVYARARSTSYYMYVGNLVIEQTS